MGLARHDLFAAPEREWSEAFGPHLAPLTDEQRTGLKFAGRVSILMTLATQNDIPAAGLRKVRRQLAAIYGVAATEREIAAVMHRNWMWIGRRDVPSYEDAFFAAGTFWHVQLAMSEAKL